MAATPADRRVLCGDALEHCVVDAARVGDREAQEKVKKVME